MNLALFVYIAGTINSVMVLLSFLCGAIIVLVISVFIFNDFFERKNDKGYPISERDDNAYFNQNVLPKRLKARTLVLKYSAPALIFLAMLITFLPSERTLYMMAGAYATEQVVKNERVSKISSDVLDVIENKLKDLKK